MGVLSTTAPTAVPLKQRTKTALTTTTTPSSTAISSSSSSSTTQQQQHRSTRFRLWKVGLVGLMVSYGVFIYWFTSSTNFLAGNNDQTKNDGVEKRVVHNPGMLWNNQQQQQREREQQQRRQQPQEPLNPPLPVVEVDKVPRLKVVRHHREALHMPPPPPAAEKKEKVVSWLSSLSKISSGLFFKTSLVSQTKPGTISEHWYLQILKEMESKLPATLPNENQGTLSHLTSCRRSSSSGGADSSSTSYSTDRFSHCRSLSASGPFYYYNPLPKHDRIVCGKIIPPKKTLVLSQLCEEPSRLFPTLPTPHSGTDMPPVVVRFSNGIGAKPTPFSNCDVSCHEAGKFSLLTKRFVDGTNWEITMSMEGPRYYDSLIINPDGWKEGKFWSTTSFRSEIPLPYYSRAEYKIWDDPGVTYGKAIHGAVFIARNCGSKNNREKVVKDMIEWSSTNAQGKFRVDSVSSCLKNADPPPGSNKADKKSILQKYLFYLAFENQCVEDYITEKLWGPMEAGTVPIYFGAPNVQEFVPPHSIISVHDFENIDAVMKHVLKVSQNKTLYESYHAWRTLPRPEFDRKLNLTYTHGTCRTCRWAYARLYGLGWNHPQQQVEDLHIPRSVCIHPTTGLLQHPVQESWSSFPNNNGPLRSKRTSMSSSSSTTGSPFCLEGTLAQDEITLETSDKDDSSNPQVLRIIRQVDGVLDMELHALVDTVLFPLTLKLETKLIPTSFQFTQVNPGHGRWQDANSRLTILASPKKGASDYSDNVVVTIHSLPLRLRFISEDVNTFHQGADQAENYFGGVMIKDFYYPTEAFYSG